MSSKNSSSEVINRRSLPRANDSDEIRAVKTQVSSVARPKYGKVGDDGAKQGLRRLLAVAVGA